MLRGFRLGADFNPTPIGDPLCPAAGSATAKLVVNSTQAAAAPLTVGDSATDVPVSGSAIARLAWSDDVPETYSDSNAQREHSHFRGRPTPARGTKTCAPSDEKP
jgi:hypothetical protein